MKAKLLFKILREALVWERHVSSRPSYLVRSSGSGVGALGDGVVSTIVDGLKYLGASNVGDIGVCKALSDLVKTVESGLKYLVASNVGDVGFCKTLSDLVETV